MRGVRHPKAVPMPKDPELGPIQARLVAIAREHGLTLEGTMARLGEIIESKDEGAALVGIRTFFDYTVGRPATTAKTLNLHASAKSDRFFEAALFEKPPVPRIED